MAFLEIEYFTVQLGSLCPPFNFTPLNEAQCFVSQFIYSESGIFPLGTTLIKLFFFSFFFFLLAALHSLQVQPKSGKSLVPSPHIPEDYH